MEKKTVFSGMRPTGRLQLGNLTGALDSWIKLQDKYRCLFCVVDWHALTTAYEDPTQLKENTYDMVINWLAAGLDPEKSIIFRQSDVKEHAELHLLLSMFTPLSWLERVPTYKDQLQQLKGKDLHTYGFLGYPLLMAADILLYRAEAVPVGEDQIPHLEITREIARRFNYLYRQQFFPEPEAILNKVKILPGIDGRKMSKSYGNTIDMSDHPDEIRKKVRKMVTDPGRIRKNDPGNPDVCTAFVFHGVFNTEEVANVEQVCRRGEIGCVQCKKQLAERIVSFLEPIYERRQALENKKDYIRAILTDGAKRASALAAENMAKVRELMNLGQL
ncbi:MAG: tryptophan--tRNA ligase [Firmicutes bacterium]|nr:tryptophan--tRNA ligase [Bacillota bacterium]